MSELKRRRGCSFVPGGTRRASAQRLLVVRVVEAGWPAGSVCLSTVVIGVSFCFCSQIQQTLSGVLT